MIIESRNMFDFDNWYMINVRDGSHILQILSLLITMPKIDNKKEVFCLISNIIEVDIIEIDQKHYNFCRISVIHKSNI